MADGMDKAYFLRQQDTDLEWAYESLWAACTEFDGAKDLSLGVVDTDDGGFMVCVRRPGAWTVWRVTAEGDVRTVTGAALVRWLNGQ